MKHLSPIALFLLITQFCWAQNFSVGAKIIDAADQKALPGAHIQLTNNQDFQQTAISNENGFFRFREVPNGQYQLSISFIGYQVHQQEVIVDGQRAFLGRIALKEGVDLQEVEVVEQTLSAVQKNDTTEFNANAYKTLPDANAEDLITKMPTVTLEDGKVQAQGEDVKQVLVDGKPFFGEDPTAALRTLPAEVIDKIQVFDQQSDQSKFTGFDDGNATKTINIITKANMRNGQFGKVYAGYGTDDRYQAGGNINYFNGDQRISIIGLTNNINKQNFSSEDLLGVIGSSGQGGPRGRGRRRGPGRNSSGPTSDDFLVSQQEGITASTAFGLNFSDKWGENTDVAASYFFNRSDNDTEQSLSQQYFDEEGLNEQYVENSLVQSENINHRFTGRIEHNFNRKDALIWRPKLSWQGNDGQETILGQNQLNDQILSETNNAFNADLSALNLTQTLLWRHRFNTRRRTFSASINNSYAPEKGERYLEASNDFGDEQSILNQFTELDQNKWSASANLHYTEPIGERSMLMLNYRASYQEESNDQSTFDFDDGEQNYSVLNEELSNVFANDYYSMQAGGGFNRRAGKVMMMVRANVQWAQLINEQNFPFSDEFNQTFWNVLPMARIEYRPSSSEHLRLFYRTSTQLPQIEQLQEVIDNTNPLQLSIGNSTLRQSTQYSLFARYNKTNTQKSTVLFAMLGGSFTNDYIAQSTYLSASDFPQAADFDLDPDAQITQVANLDGYWNLRSLLTYGFPVQLIKSNLNIDLGATYQRTPGQINEAINYANNTSTTLGLTLASNVSDRLDFTLASRSRYNIAKNSLQSASNTNYLNQQTSLKFDWIIFQGIIFRTNLTHQFFDGLSDGFNQNYLLWNMSIGKKLFKNERGEISLSVFDLLKQNNSLTRNIEETYIEDVQTNVLQQYVMLNFKYDLRHFKVKK